MLFECRRALSAALLRVFVPDTEQDTPRGHIIQALGRSNLSLEHSVRTKNLLMQKCKCEHLYHLGRVKRIWYLSPMRAAKVQAQSRQNLRCSLIQAVSHEEPSDTKPDPWPL